MTTGWNLGDVPTWVAAFGTSGAVAAAIGLARRDRRRSDDQRHRSQAERISGWLGDDDEELQVQYLELLNDSHEPVYELVAALVFIQGAGPRTIEEQSAADVGLTTIVSVLPPGRWRVSVAFGWHGMSRAGGVEVQFTDRSGSHWVRRSSGHLEETSEGAIQHLGLTGPFMFQTPDAINQ